MLRRRRNAGILGIDQFIYPSVGERVYDLCRRTFNRLCLPTGRMLGTPPQGRFIYYPFHMAPESMLGNIEINMLAYGGILHDIGKIGIPEPVLRKAVPLTDEETALMREHPAIGAEIVTGVEFLRDALPAIKSHHERWDGAGYPEGLAGDRIPLVARIVNAADTWDACTSSRPYQPAMDAAAVLRILEKLRGTQIDPQVHDALLAVVDRWTGGAISRARADRGGAGDARATGSRT